MTLIDTNETTSTDTASEELTSAEASTEEPTSSDNLASREVAGDEVDEDPSDDAPTSTEVTSTDTPAEGATSTDTAGAAPTVEENKRKRPHTSPRLLALREVDTEIATLRTKWEADTNAASRDDVLSVLAMLSESVGVLKGGHPKVGAGGEKSSSPRPANPYAGKRHYVGKVGATGKFVYVDSLNKAPTPIAHPTLSAVFGPFRTEGGARYAVEHPESLTGRSDVFAARA